MTAGSGIIHQEMPKGGEDKLRVGIPTLGESPGKLQDDCPALPRSEEQSDS